MMYKSTCIFLQKVCTDTRKTQTEKHKFITIMFPSSFPGHFSWPINALSLLMPDFVHFAGFGCAKLGLITLFGYNR